MIKFYCRWKGRQIKANYEPPLTELANVTRGNNIVIIYFVGVVRIVLQGSKE